MTVTPQEIPTAMSVSDEGNRKFDPGAEYQGMDRRSKPRISKPFPVRVRGIDGDGHQFEVDVSLDNLSAGGLYLRLSRVVPKGTRLFFLIKFSSGSEDWGPGLKVAARGVVVREQSLLCGDCGIAVAFTRYRII